MVVRLDLERRREAAAYIDNAGVLAWALKNELALCRKPLEMHARRFVRAVLGPHNREDAELGVTGSAAEQFDYSFVFFFGESVALNEFGSNGRFGHVVMYAIDLRWNRSEA